MKTLFGTLNAAKFFLQKLVTSSSSMLDPSLGITAQFICSSQHHRDKNIHRQNKLGLVKSRCVCVCHKEHQMVLVTSIIHNRL